MNSGKNSGDEAMEIRGELTRKSSVAPLRALAVITGLILIKGLWSLFARFALAFRKTAVLRLNDSSLVLDAEWSMLGRKFRSTTTTAPISDIRAVQLENRQRYLYLLFGFGCLAIGTWLGIQWFVDGLRAGFPYLALLGAGIVAAGILIDLVLYLLVPRGVGRSRLLLVLGPWKVVLTGVDEDAALQFVNAVGRLWNKQPAKRA